MSKMEISKEDAKEVIAGGLPKDPKLRPIALAAKYVLAHKGPIMPNERKHLATMGLTDEHVAEIAFCVGEMRADNYLMVHLVANGAPIEPFLQQMGPFADTLYKKE
mmetsp:Transcript_4053/g.7459  ORF Transcript_4053/g.7459 Transcript_4053/m.7459 type:complete len:106 (-) Transcript_4053:471-788(-)|eukprot:CAMPEP_0197516752 /NCGR_PEP_ID=MMETSP1318-20131121/1675_1 /TAXON_ID=552666 /ORGANISM="Partenskyella glossopodia, Strain RCC365" /LENGTH=105 /DNA_ID=CAMNT_0043065745 /DNA_START=355 /DNA_END=672 /DNA_ORIENTATION=+